MNIDYGRKTVIKNSVMSIIWQTVSLILSMISAPLILDCLGTTKYGVWASVLSIVSWIYYFDLGIGNGFRNKFASCLANDDIDSARKYLGVSYIIVAVISAIAFSLVFVFLSLVNVSILFDVSDIGENLNQVLLVAILIACLNFVIQLVNNILYAYQKASMVNFFNVLAQAFWIVALLCFLNFRITSLLYIATANGVCQLLKNVIASRFAQKKFPELRGAFKHVDFSYKKGIMSLGIQIFIMQIAALVLNTTDNLIILNFFGADDVTPYSFCYKYFGIVISVYGAVIAPLTSAYTAAYEQKNVAWIKKTLKASSLIMLVFILGTIVASFVFEPFSIVWLKKKLFFQPGLIACTALYIITELVSNTYASFVYGIGKVKIPTIATAFQAVINIPLSIIFAVNLSMGVNGIILGSVISMLISAIIDPIIAIIEVKRLEKK